MWIPSIIFRPVFWLTVLLLITPALSIMCVSCTPLPNPDSCDNKAAIDCGDKEFDLCNTKVDRNGKSQDRQCIESSTMLGNRSIVLGCQPGYGSEEWCVCNTDNCNSGDVPTLKKVAEAAAGKGKGDASSFLKDNSKVLFWTGVFLAGLGSVPRLNY